MVRSTKKRLLAVALMFAMLVGCIFPATTVEAAGVSSSNVGALLDSYAEANDETYTLTEKSRIFVVSDSEPTGELLQTAQLIQREFAAAGYPNSSVMDMVWGPESYAWAGDIVLKVDSANSTIGTEGYLLEVGSTATITGKDVDGLIYGANSLMKCFGYGNSMSLIGFTAYDTPDTAQRVVSLDTGRKYYTAEWICNFIRQMSWMGYNALQLHFSEDGGFRADIWDSNYFTSANGNDFSWLCGSKTQYWVYNGNKNNSSYDYQTDPDAGKYLTAAELVEICEVAEEYHIDIIPSFDSPAHMDYITWRYEQYAKSTGFSFKYNGTTYTANSSKNYCVNYTGTTGKDSPTWYYAAVDITEGSVGEAFVLALYTDIADFFKQYAGSTDFSIGADEVGQGSSVKWGYSNFVTYINKLNKLLNDKGYTMRMYNDFLGSTTYNYSSTTSTSKKYTFDSNIEIMYWDSPFNQNNNSSSGTATVKASILAEEGFKQYNCMQSNCYYVLRVANASSVSSTYKYMDARNPDNLNWSFNYATEQRIYETWTPNDFGEKGKYSTTDVVSSNVEGAYFLIWNDYAALNTEKEVWEGVYDNTGTDNSEYYSLFDRMWSNTMKMWNWDVDDSVGYTTFKAVRETYGYFPGYTSCSADAYLPTATSPTQAYLADHSALETVLEDYKVENDGYTEDSYSAYETAYAAAKDVNENYGATADEIATAIANLKAAVAALEEVEITESNFRVECKLNGASEPFAVLEAIVTTNMYYLKPMTGYTVDRVEGGTFVALPSNDGSGFINVSLLANGVTTVTVWYENTPDVSRLNDLIAEAEDRGDYSEDSWNTYSSALTVAETLVNGLDTDTHTQADVNAALAALEAARNGLVISGSENEIFEVEKLSATARLGKLVGLRITTSASVGSISVSAENVAETLSICAAKVQSLSDYDEPVKVWYVAFPADKAGEFTYTITAGTATQELNIIVQ